MNQYHVVMEIDPRFTQYPASLQDMYVSTSGAAPSGTATTNAPLATVLSPAPNTHPQNALAVSGWGKAQDKAEGNAEATSNSESARNSAINALANGGRGGTSSGSAVSTSPELMIPLAAVSRYNAGRTPMSISHQGLFVASTISFALRPGATLSEAATEFANAMNEIRMPAAIHGAFAGTARVFQQSVDNEPILIAAAIATVYILLGILYESYTHPITILSTLPSAGLGALLALLLFHMEFDIIGFVGLILLIGIVMKNAIMMIDFAIQAERSQNVSAHDAIVQACILRFRPIMMTTVAAILGALPLALSFGNGGEIRRPLGVTIVGGLIVSQLLTLYTTPVLYLCLDRVAQWSLRWRRLLFRTSV